MWQQKGSWVLPWYITKFAALGPKGTQLNWSYQIWKWTEICGAVPTIGLKIVCQHQALLLYTTWWDSWGLLCRARSWTPWTLWAIFNSGGSAILKSESSNAYIYPSKQTSFLCGKAVCFIFHKLFNPLHPDLVLAWGECLDFWPVGSWKPSARVCWW